MSLHLYFVVSCDAENCTTDPLHLDAESIPDAMLELEQNGWRYLFNGGFACGKCIERVSGQAPDKRSNDDDN